MRTSALSRKIVSITPVHSTGTLETERDGEFLATGKDSLNSAACLR